jgi:cytochrome P450
LIKFNILEEFTDHQLLIAVYDLFAAGLETTATTSRTFIFYMLHYPKVQAKIHAEIDNVIGRESVSFFYFLNDKIWFLAYYYGRSG